MTVRQKEDLEVVRRGEKVEAEGKRIEVLRADFVANHGLSGGGREEEGDDGPRSDHMIDR